MRGSATRSYGIEVASLAGIPTEITNRAKELMQELEENKVNTISNDNEIVNMLKEIDVNKISPISAFETLLHLAELAKKQ